MIITAHDWLLWLLPHVTARFIKTCSTRKYKRTFYVGMGRVHGSRSVINIIKWAKTLTDKKPLLYYAKNVPWVLTTQLRSWENHKWSFDFVILFSSSVLFQLHHMWLENHRAHMSVLHVKGMLYYQRGVFSGLELHARHNWWVMIQNMHCSRFLRPHFVHSFGHNLQTLRCILPFYIPNFFFTKRRSFLC